jgi:hypothetical protein
MIRIRKLDSFLYEVAQNYDIFYFKYSKLKLKNQKSIAVDVLFNGTTLMQTEYGQTLPLNSKCN